MHLCTPPPVKPQFLCIDDRIIPRRASFFCHVAIPCFHLENTNAHRQSDMFSAPVPFEHGEHHHKRLYIASESVCHNSLSTVLQVSRAVVLPPLELVSAC